MITVSYTLDMFNPKCGLLMVEYNIFDRIKEETSISNELVKRQIEARVRNIICDKIERMRNQRSENYRYGDLWSITSSQALFSLPLKITGARSIKDMPKFAQYVKTDIRPLINNITPGTQSRFYKNFTEKLSKLDSYIDYIIKNPDFANVLKPATNQDFSI